LKRERLVSTGIDDVLLSAEVLEHGPEIAMLADELQSGLRTDALNRLEVIAAKQDA
jgi:hypothetical protein